MTKSEHFIRADQPPPVQHIGEITAETLGDIERRVKELAGHMRRLGMAERQLLEDVGALIRFARHAKGL